MPSRDSAASRRKLLQFVAASPLLAHGASGVWAAEIAKPLPKLPDPLTWAPLNPDVLIKSSKEAINVFDFELVARQNVPPSHFGYMASGIDDEVTLRANRQDFQKFQLLPRRLNDVSKIDTRVELFGVTYGSPVFLCPIGGQGAYETGAEVTVAAGAKAGNHLQILSTHASTSINDVMEARGAPVWFQLYATSSLDVAKALVKRAENAGSPVMAITIDRVTGRNQETRARLQLTDDRTCRDCHDNKPPRPAFDGIDTTGVNMISANLTWDFVRRIRDATKMKVVLKGIITPEDAKLCVDSGFDGFIVSNHGGRAEDSGRSSIDALPEIIAAAGRRIPVLVDSGFRRGTDVVKALAMGASAVGIGRPYVWGLGAFGQEGVERVLEIVQTETEVAMGQCGASSVKKLTPALVRRV